MYLHGVELQEITDGIKPIQVVSTSVIGIVGTAPDADADAFPLDTPVVILGSRLAAANLDLVGDGLGTLPAALDGILDQAGALVIVVRVEEDVDPSITLTNVIGGVDVATGTYTGLQALLASKGSTGLSPKILIAPGFSHEAAVITELVSIADRLRAMVYADGPNTNDADAIAFIDSIGSKRVVVCDPWVTVFDSSESNNERIEPVSARIAGLRAKVDSEEGYHVAISNHTINGIIGTVRPIDYNIGDAACAANVLNEAHVATIINEDGWRFWGTRVAQKSDTTMLFEPVVRVNDIINESIQLAHQWAVDRNITVTYAEDVVEGINQFMRSLTVRNIILGGEAWFDPELNTSADIVLGMATFDFDFTPAYPAEHVIMRSQINNDRLEEIF